MNALEQGVLLHMGLPKTGTTTIQQTLFSGHPEIYYIGKCAGKVGKVPQGCLSQEIFDFLNPLIWDITSPLDVDKYRAILRRQILPRVDHGKFLVGSWETLVKLSATQYAEIIRRLQLIFGSCRVMMTIRNPLDQIPSQYLQHIRGCFIRQNKPWMGNLPYIYIDEWLKRRLGKNQTLEDVFPYSRNIQTAVNLLGKENVGIFVFEELINDPAKYYRAICDFIGIDIVQGLDLTRQKHLNKRITQGHVEYLQQLNNSTWNKWIIKIMGRQYRIRLFDANAGDGVPAKVSLPSQWEQRISDATRAGNRWITENYHLPLEKYNYPL